MYLYNCLCTILYRCYSICLRNPLCNSQSRCYSM